MLFRLDEASVNQKEKRRNGQNKENRGFCALHFHLWEVVLSLLPPGFSLWPQHLSSSLSLTWALEVGPVLTGDQAFVPDRGDGGSPWQFLWTLSLGFEQRPGA